MGGDRDPYLIFDAAFTDGPLNMTAFQTPEIDEQLDILRTTTDLEERKAAVEAIGLVINENVPNTFAGGTLTVMAAREAVKNLDGWVFPDGDEGQRSRERPGHVGPRLDDGVADPRGAVARPEQRPGHRHRPAPMSGHGGVVRIA